MKIGSLSSEHSNNTDIQALWLIPVDSDLFLFNFIRIQPPSQPKGNRTKKKTRRLAPDTPSPLVQIPPRLSSELASTPNSDPNSKNEGEGGIAWEKESRCSSRPAFSGVKASAQEFGEGFEAEGLFFGDPSSQPWGLHRGPSLWCPMYDQTPRCKLVGS